MTKTTCDGKFTVIYLCRFYVISLLSMLIFVIHINILLPSHDFAKTSLNLLKTYLHSSIKLLQPQRSIEVYRKDLKLSYIRTAMTSIADHRNTSTVLQVSWCNNNSRYQVTQSTRLNYLQQIQYLHTQIIVKVTKLGVSHVIYKH